MTTITKKTIDSTGRFLGIAFVVAAFVVTFALTLYDPSPLEVIALFVLIILLPFFFSRPHAGFLVLLIARPAIDFIGQNVSIIIEDFGSLNVNALIGIFIFLWGLGFIILRRIQIGKIPLTFPLIALSLATLVSLWQSEFLVLSFGEWIRITDYFILFTLAFYFTKNWHDFIVIVKALLLSTIIPMLFALHQIVTKTGLADEASSNRIPGTFSHPAQYGHYLAFILVVLFGIIIYYHKKQFKERNFLMVFALSQVVLLFLTYTRGAWLFAILSIGIMTLIHYRKKAIIYAGYTALGLLLLIGTGALLETTTRLDFSDYEIVARITDSFSIEPGSSVFWRIQFWQRVTDPLEEVIYTGAGAGTFVEFADQELNARFDAHNDYLKLIVETGIFGFLTFAMMLIIFTLFGLAQLIKSKTPEFRILASIYFASMLSLTLLSIGDNIYQNTTLYWMVMVFLGSSSAIFLRLRKKQK